MVPSEAAVMLKVEGVHWCLSFRIAVILATFLALLMALTAAAAAASKSILLAHSAGTVISPFNESFYHLLQQQRRQHSTAKL